MKAIFALAALGLGLAQAVQVEGITLPDCILDCIGSPQAVKHFCGFNNHLDQLFLCAAVCPPSDMQVFLAAEKAMCAAATVVVGNPRIVYSSGKHVHPISNADVIDGNVLDLKPRQRRYVQTGGDGGDDDTSSCAPPSTVTITVSVSVPASASASASATPGPSGEGSGPPPAPSEYSSLLLPPPIKPTASPSGPEATHISATDAVGFPAPSSPASSGGGGATGGAPGTTTLTGTATLTSVGGPSTHTTPGSGGGGEGEGSGEGDNGGDNGGNGPSATSSGPPGVPTTGAAMALLGVETGVFGALAGAFWLVALF